MSVNTDSPFETNFDSIFDHCREDFLSHLKEESGIGSEYLERIRSLIDYTCRGGKINRARFIVNTVKKIFKKENFKNTNQLVLCSYYMAVCIEAMQGCMLIADDITDRSKLRRGKVCWYLKCKMDNAAINDSFIVESFAFFIIKRFIKDPQKRLSLLELYHDVILKTEIGQMLDNYSAIKPKTVSDLEKRLNIKNYRLIATNKTAYYTFYLSLSTALILVEKDSPEKLKYARKLSEELGRKFQKQDDFMDCFSAPEVIGKIGIDIEENKCTWLAVKAMELANNKEKEIMLKHYGKNDINDVKQIKALYERLNLREEFLEDEKKSYEEIKALIKQNSTLIDPEIAELLLEKTHLRKF